MSKRRRGEREYRGKKEVMDHGFKLFKVCLKERTDEVGD